VITLYYVKEGLFMEFKIICDIRENLKQNIICNNINFSDHPPKDIFKKYKIMLYKVVINVAFLVEFLN
jgi:hypothetical protein